MYNITQCLKNELTRDFKAICPTFESINEYAVNEPAGKLGRAYASLVFSVRNIGLNVATRAGIQNPLYSDSPLKETGLTTTGSYSRSEKGHPSYGELKVIKDTMKNHLKNEGRTNKTFKIYCETIDGTINDYVAQAKTLAATEGPKGEEFIKQKAKLRSQQQKSANDALNTLKGSLTDEELNAGDQAALLNKALAYKAMDSDITSSAFDRNATWFGEYRTPEERLEIVFENIPVSSIYNLSTIATRVLAEQENQTTQKSLIEILEPGNEINRPANIAPIDKNEMFAKVMAYRLDMKTECMNRTVEDLAGETKFIIKNDSDYPCLIFDLRILIENIAKLKGNNGQNENEYEPFKIEDLGQTSPEVDTMINILLSYFCGLVNYYAMNSAYEYIEMQPQGSFGSIRPSITDTGYSFRISLGLAPYQYAENIKKAAKRFVDEIKNVENQKKLRKLVTLKKEIKGKTPSLVWNEKLKHNTNRIILSNLVAFHSEERSLINLLIEMEDLGDKPKTNDINKDKKLIKTETKNEKELNEQVVMEGKECLLYECTSAVALSYFRLTNSYVDYMQSDGKKRAPIKYLDNIIMTVISALNFEYDENEGKANIKKNDWCECASLLETLLRLMQIRQEVVTILKYQQELSENNNNLERRGRSISATSTDTNDINDDGDVSYSRPTRSGMAALTQCFAIVGTALADRKVTLGLEEVYFEVTKNYVENINLYYENFEHITFIRTHEKYGIVGVTEDVTIRMIDIAPFPRYSNAVTTTCRWLAKKWDTLATAKLELLIVDVTSATDSDFKLLIEKFKDQNKIPAILVFASNNKYGQGGVDLTCMGEIRLLTKKSKNEEKNKLKIAIEEAYMQITTQADHTTASMKAYRQVLKAAGLLRSTIVPVSKPNKSPIEQYSADVQAIKL